MNTSTQKRIYLNPYMTFSFAFLITLILYEMKLSEFNSELGMGISLIVWVAVVVNFMLYLVTKHRWSRAVDAAVLNSYQGNIGIYRFGTLIFLVLGIAEGIYSGGLPILGQSSYATYGIPMLHLIIVCCDSFFSLKLLKIILLHKKNRGKLIFFLIVSILPLIFGLSRGTIVILLIGFMGIFLSTRLMRLDFKIVVVWIVLAIFGIYLFGIVGNYRINHDYSNVEELDRSTLILSIGKANQRFQDSRIPKPFFWTYAYVTSPLANFKLNTQLVSVKSSDRSAGRDMEFFVVNYVPDFISKRVYPHYKEEFKPWLVTPEFTAYTALTLPYLMLGWSGVWMFLIFEMIFPLIYFELVRKFASRDFDIAMVLLSVMYVLMPFANFFTFSALSMQLVFPFITSMFTVRRIKNGVA